MFDKLVESTNVKPQGRNKFYLAITAIYGVSLTALGVLTIMWFNPMPAEAYETIGMIAPPLPTAQQPQKIIVARNVPAISFVAPQKVPISFVDPKTVTPRTVTISRIQTVPGMPQINGSTVGAPPVNMGISKEESEPPVPLPTPRITPTPTPRPEPVVTPTPKPKIIVSDMVTSKAIKKVQPPYPAIARSARVQGAVQVQVLISEEGRVVSASTVNGHPLLLDASLQAARQWVFSPTQLNGTPVKVSGVLTFNFTLN